MGTYVYTLKKASRNIIDNGQRVPVQHFSYAYKESYSFWPNAQYERVTSLMHSHAENAFDEYNGGYIVLEDVKDESGKRSDLDGVEVYKNLTKSDWIDCQDMPAEYVGYLVKKGRSYELVKCVSEYEDDRAHVKVEYHRGVSLSTQNVEEREYYIYYFTNKQTGETTRDGVGKDRDAVNYVKKSNNPAKCIFGMVI